MYQHAFTENGLFRNSTFSKLELRQEFLHMHFLKHRSAQVVNICSKLRLFGLKRTAFAVGKIPTYTARSELRMLATLALKCPSGASAVEVGSYLGASSCYLAAGLSASGGMLTCIDTWQNQTMPGGEQDTFDRFAANTREYQRVLRILRKSSADVLPTDLKLPLALVFLDGDHSYEATKRDFDTFENLVSPDGLMVFHDCSAVFPGVVRVVGEALSSGNWLLCGLEDSLCWLRRANHPPLDPT